MRPSRHWRIALVVICVAYTQFIANYAHAQACGPTTNFSWSPFATQSVDIPGMTFGKNAAGEKVIWISAYCGYNTCTWPPGSITEIDPVTGAVIAHHLSPPLGWNSTGPEGLAYDDRGFLWVASYEGRVYQVRIADFSLVASFATPPSAGRPIGGLGFDGTYLWLASEYNGIHKLDQNGAEVATYSPVPTAGVECVGGFIFLVYYDTGTIEARDLNYSLVASYDFSPAKAPASAHGDLAIDPDTGDGYWSRRWDQTVYKLHLFDRGPPASKSLYGAGWPGKTGVPSIDVSANPVLGTTISLVIGNSADQPTLGLLLVGLGKTNKLTNLDGTLLVVPAFSVLVPLPTLGLTLPGAIPDDCALAGTPVFAQVLEVDAYASKGVSFTPGLRLDLGF